MADEFSRYHPSVNFIFFVSVITFSMVFMHPVCLAISLICSITYALILNGTRAFWFNVKFMLPLLILTVVITPMFNHQGVTILTYLRSSNPLTLESIVYSVVAGVMLVSVISWFSCYNRIMTSDKFMYLFGRIIPALSLVISMTLRFVPRFTAHLKTVRRAQRSIGADISDVKFIDKIKNGAKIVRIMITWSFENAVETADSMKSRGYGLKGRTNYSNYKFYKHDILALVFLFVCDFLIIGGAFLGKYTFRYYPMITPAYFDYSSIIAYAVYFVMCLVPVIINVWEGLKWKHTQSKI